jgi:hypothetical protein
MSSHDFRARRTAIHVDGNSIAKKFNVKSASLRIPRRPSTVILSVAASLACEWCREVEGPAVCLYNHHRCEEFFPHRLQHEQKAGSSTTQDRSQTNDPAPLGMTASLWEWIRSGRVYSMILKFPLQRIRLIKMLKRVPRPCRAVSARQGGDFDADMNERKSKPAYLVISAVINIRRALSSRDTNPVPAEEWRFQAPAGTR